MALISIQQVLKPRLYFEFLSSRLFKKFYIWIAMFFSLRIVGVYQLIKTKNFLFSRIYF